jgi:hypothetical protein
MSTHARQPRTAEHGRLADFDHRDPDPLASSDWHRWGPYLSERAWGTVREDYSAGGDAWSSFPHDHARSRVYRWNEDGLAGLCDSGQRLCLGLALWNGRDPILKERVYGLTGPEGNHGEDAKDYWWYLDAVPSHAWLRWRYHYPQAPFPYADLVAENGRRGLHDPEYELLDTGVFDDDRYWSVEVTYAKASPTDVLMQIDIENHGPDDARLHVLPTLWFRNTWAWSATPVPRPSLHLDGDAIRADHPELGSYRFLAAPAADPPEALFCENETNTARHYGIPTLTPYPKDGINDHVVAGAATVSPEATGTKAAWWYRLAVPAGGRTQLRLRLHDVTAPTAPKANGRPWHGSPFARTLAARRREADEFHESILPEGTAAEQAAVVRQAAAGLVWSKQYYPYRVSRWLDGDPGQPAPPPGRAGGRNAGWRHLDPADVLAMPDPWEYPWFAAWDLAFHAIAWAHLDPAFAKHQILVLLREWFQHPNGAMPAYEWNFDDVNPPVHAVAALRIFQLDGGRDVDFLERAFQKLVVNYTWWLNRQDPEGNNLFGGGFLGLDNISAIDRSHLPPGATLEQADGSAWMAFYSLSMLAMAVVLAEHDPVYEEMAVTFLEQFARITRAINTQGIYDPERGFFYDRMVTPAGPQCVAVETIGGAVPLFSSAVVRTEDGERRRMLGQRLARILDREGIEVSDLESLGRLRREEGRGELLVSVATPEQLRRTLAEVLDEGSFLSPYGLRGLSKRYEGRPYVVTVGDASYAVDYEPAESTTPMYGGNSNWRGPVWFPVNWLAIRSLVRFHEYLGDGFTVEHPTGSGRQQTLRDVAQDLSDRLTAIFLPRPDGSRPVFGGTKRFQDDPAWHDNLLFFEYFHGDNGAGLGATHQTGWTALVIDLVLDPPRAARTLPVRSGRAAGDR